MPRRGRERIDPLAPGFDLGDRVRPRWPVNGPLKDREHVVVEFEWLSPFAQAVFAVDDDDGTWQAGAWVMARDLVEVEARQYLAEEAP